MKRFFEIVSDFKGFFALIFSGASFLHMAVLTLFGTKSVPTLSLWQLLASAFVATIIQYLVSESAFLPKMHKWIKLVAGYLVLLGTFSLFPQVFCFIHGTGMDTILYLGVVTLFYFGLQFGLYIVYKLTGNRMNQMLNMRRN